MVDIFLKLAFITGVFMIMLLLLVALGFILYMIDRYELKQEFKNWDGSRKLTYSSPLNIGDLESEIKKQFLSRWNGRRFFKPEDNKFILKDHFFKAAIQAHQNNSGSIVQLKVRYPRQLKILLAMVFLFTTALTIVLFVSDDAEINGEPATLWGKFGMLALLTFFSVIIAFLLNLGKEDFQKEILRKLKLSSDVRRLTSV